MTGDEVEAAQVLSIFRDLLRRRALLSQMTRLSASVFFTGEGDDFIPERSSEFGVSDDDALVAIKNRAAKIIADKLAAYRALLKIYFTEDALREIERDAEPPARPGLSNEPKPDRQLAEGSDGERV